VSSDTPVDTVADERGDVLESVFWGGVFAITLAMFYYEFVLGVLEPEEAGSFPIATVVDFKQAMFLAAIIGGGGVVALVVYSVFRYGSGVRAAAEPLRPGQGSLKLAVFVLAVFAVMSTTSSRARRCWPRPTRRPPSRRQPRRASSSRSPWT
jgi:hypothetical protein